MAVINKSAKKSAKKRAKKNDKLNVLLSAAMALPGMSAHAQEVGVRSDSVTLDYNHAEYKESDDRMEVEVDQLSITVPIASQFELKANMVKDVISGASPVMYIARPIDIDKPEMVKQAGASIKDERDVLEVAAAYYGSNNYVSTKIGHSEEDDYEANFGGIDYIHYFNNKNTNLLAGYALSDDEAWNVHFSEGSSNFDPFLDKTRVRDRKQQDFMVGVNQVLSKNDHIQISLTSVNASGDLSDPYKKVYIQDQDNFDIPTIYNNIGGTPEALEQFTVQAIEDNPLVSEISEEFRNSMGVYADSRPDNRQQNILLLRYSRYFEFADAGMHLDYRYSDDEWGATSATIEAKWSQALPGGVIVTPGIRYYSQDSADFYQPIFVSKPSDNYYSSDYRLAGFGAYSYKLAIDKTFFEQLSLRVSYEYYEREYDLAWSSSSSGSSVDDYNYDLFSFSLGYRF